MIEVMRRLVVAAALAGALAGNMDEIEKFFDDTVKVSRQVATAGDLRSISSMLDYTFMKTGRYPKTERFGKWMRSRFKENDLRDIEADHWGNPYRYVCAPDRKSYTLTCAGEDGRMDTADDMKRTGP